MWQQLDQNGIAVWAHSVPALSVDQQHLLNALDLDALDTTGFSTTHMPAGKHVIVELLDSNETLLLGTDAFPVDTNLAAVSMDFAVGSAAAPGSVSVVAWSKTSSAESLYEVGGLTAKGSPRLVRINGHDLFTAGGTLGGSTDLPTRCPECVNYNGSVAVIAGSGADQFFVDARVGQTNLFGAGGDDTFHVFGSDHLGSLLIDAGAGGANTATLGSSNNLFGIQGPVRFEGGNCEAALYVTMEDSTDTVSRNVSIQSQPGSNIVSGLAPAAVTFSCDTLLGSFPTYLDLHAGPKSDIVRIDRLAIPELHIDGTDGEDSVEVSLHDDGLAGGMLFLKNTAGSMGISIDARASTSPSDFDLRADNVYISNRTTQARLGWVIWNTPAAVDVANVSLALGSAANSVEIARVPDNVDYFVYGGDGGTRMSLAGEKIGQNSLVALVGGAGRDTFTMTPASPASALISIDGGGEPAGCARTGCGDVLNYLGVADGAVPTDGMLLPPFGSPANVVYFYSIDAFDSIFSGCFETVVCGK